MHFHTEVWVPTANDIGHQVDDAMAPFDENGENADDHQTFYDWYQIGGRWTGAHDDYDPTTDPRNIGDCRLCHGTGVRDDAVGLTLPKNADGYNCNGCVSVDEKGNRTYPRGPGKALQWPTQFAFHPGDVISVDELRRTKSDLRAAYVVVNGEVFGEDTSWGDEDKDKGRTVLEVLDAANIHGGFLVTVDCHD